MTTSTISHESDTEHHADSFDLPVSADGQPLRVLHIITRLVVGGAMENTLLTVIGQQQDPRFSVTLFSGIDLGPEGNLHDFARQHGVELVLSPHLLRRIDPWHDLRALIELVRFIKAGRFHVVHTHASKAGIIGRLAARLAGTPVVVHTLHGLVFHEFQRAWLNWFYIQLKRICAPFTHQYISVCEATRKGAIAARIGRPEAHATVFSGMDLEPFLDVETRLTRNEARARFGLPPEVPVVGKLGRLFPLKGHDQFIEMAAKLNEQHPDVHFLLIGDGILREQLEADVAARGLSGVVHFAGLIPPEEVPAALLAMDVVVHTSLREGIARVLPQALAVGRPAVVYDLDGAPEVIENGKSGYVVPVGDTTAMAAQVRELLDHPDRRRAFADHGRAFVAREYPVERMVERVTRLYERHLLERGLMVMPATGAGHEG